jgi:tRNA G10  N-methylase Trm11
VKPLPPHPAQFPDKVIQVCASILMKYDMRRVLDPMAGTGKVAGMKWFGFTGDVYCNDIEREWKRDYFPVDGWTFDDAANLPWNSGVFDAIVTSPTWGNRMADHHNAKDQSRRMTYRHCLGRKLTEGNTGNLQWGEAYKKMHRLIYDECIRVLKPGGIFIVNVGNHIRKGKVVDVVAWHRQELLSKGLNVLKFEKVPAPKMGFGANREKRVFEEWVLAFVKGEV